MSDARDANQTSPLTTTPIGGGRRAWLIALAALVVLGTFVYVGISGGSSAVAPNASPTAPALAAVGTPGAASTPFVSYDPNAIVSIRADPTAPVLYQYLGAALTIHGRGVLAVLDPVGPLAYRGIYRIPVSQAAQTAQLAFDAVTASVSHDDVDQIGQWTFPINSIAQGTGPPVIVLDEIIGASSQVLSNPDFSRLSSNGYHLTVTTQNQGDAALMTVDVAVNRDQYFPTESYGITAGDATSPVELDLENVGMGSWDGQTPIPDALVGTTTSVTLSAISRPAAGAPQVTAPLGTWSIRVSRRPRPNGRGHIEVHTDAQQIGQGDPLILGSGYDLYIDQAIVDGKLNLRAILQVRLVPLPGPTPAPSTR